MRNCPVCNYADRELMWSMPYQVPDGWPLPDRIDWYTCDNCGMLYGDGDFNQETYNRFYREYYGYGVNSHHVGERLTGIAAHAFTAHGKGLRFADFGGSGDDGKSIACEHLKSLGVEGAYNINAGDEIPYGMDVILASHVMEHVYDMEAAMNGIFHALKSDGTLIIDGPDATGLLLEWKMPILDFHTKHINHFRVIDYLRLGENYGFELVDMEKYIDVRSNQTARSVRLYFKLMNTARESRIYVMGNVAAKVKRLEAITEPVNVWGLGDMAWHVLAQVPGLPVLDYIDNDPAMRGQTYNGKPILDTPRNGAPIVVIAQGQIDNLLNRIKLMGIMNEVVKI